MEPPLASTSLIGMAGWDTGADEPRLLDDAPPSGQQPWRCCPLGQATSQAAVTSEASWWNRFFFRPVTVTVDDVYQMPTAFE